MPTDASSHQRASKRALRAALGLFALGACGDAGTTDRTPTIVLPLEPPAGVEGLVAEFVEICSQSMLNRTEAGATAASRGWEIEPGSAAAMAQIGMIAASKPDEDASLMLMPIDFPHQSGENCQLNVFSPDRVEGIDVSTLDGMPGFLGGVQRVAADGDVALIGRWSAIGPDGGVVTVSATRATERFLTLNMTTTHPVDPPEQ